MTLLLAMLGIKVVTSTLIYKLFKFKQWSKRIMASIMLVLWTPVAYAAAMLVI
jgi:hypothetical protein